MDYKPISTMVVVAISFMMWWIALEFGMWIYLGMLSSWYFSFGPSSTLVIPLTGIAIDTWSRWSLFAINSAVSIAVVTFCEDVFQPWMTREAMALHVRNPHNPRTTIFIVQCYHLVHNVSGVLYFMLLYTQVDIAIICIFTSVLVGTLATARLLKKQDEYANAVDVKSSLDAEQDIELF
jgi:hypothetical protein